MKLFAMADKHCKITMQICSGDDCFGLTSVEVEGNGLLMALKKSGKLRTKNTAKLHSNALLPQGA